MMFILICQNSQHVQTKRILVFQQPAHAGTDLSFLSIRLLHFKKNAMIKTMKIITSQFNETEFQKNQKKTNLKKLLKITVLVILLLSLSFCTIIAVRAFGFKKSTSAKPLTQVQIQQFESFLVQNYPQNYQILKNLPYNISEPKLDVWANSAIIIDTSNGNILYEKNADKIIPPASMTKLFAMYVVEEEVSKGNLSYEQKIPLPPESWACNMPPRSSLMFLGKGQNVTLEELLLGLSICSGNDAAYALAYITCGSMETFVERMNQVAENLGLQNTHFVESSGYSENNTTTAREMAAFCRIYIQNHPESIKRFHSVLDFTYPKKHNLADGDVIQAQDFSKGIPEHITMPITQKNTNPLLGKLEGVDGLKTGYIDESGYNLSLTAVRNGTRFLSVTMEGPGNSSVEGQKGRVHDGTELMEWAFSSFADFSLEMYSHPYFVRVFGAKEKGINLIPALTDKTLSVPYVYGENMEENLQNVKVYLNIENLYGSVNAGDICGNIKIYLEEYLLLEIPLLADRTVSRSNFVIRLADRIVQKTADIISD